MHIKLFFVAHLKNAFQRRVMRTKLDIYVFIANKAKHLARIIVISYAMLETVHLIISVFVTIFLLQYSSHNKEPYLFFRTVVVVIKSNQIMTNAIFYSCSKYTLSYDLMRLFVLFS